MTKKLRRESSQLSYLRMYRKKLTQLALPGSIAVGHRRNCLLSSPRRGPAWTEFGDQNDFRWNPN
jgi:hypothetical protein